MRFRELAEIERVSEIKHIRTVGDQRGGTSCQEVINPPIRKNKNDRQNISKKATRHAAFPKRRQNSVLGPPSIRFQEAARKAAPGEAVRDNKAPVKSGGHKGGEAAAARPAEARAASARKAAATRKKSA